jgi:hypothetical protein
MSSALIAPPVAARLATHPMGRDARTISLFLLFALCLMPIHFASPGIDWSAILLLGLAAVANEACSCFNTVPAAVGVRSPLAQRLEQVKVS